jgi:ArsR family transcriptional regulator, arsenate/arsenite/antimonite-responsive transcriptional repressor
VAAQSYSIHFLEYSETCILRGALMKTSTDYGTAAQLLKTLGHPIRLALLGELVNGPKCVSDIQDLVDVRQANVSQHLAILRRAKLVSCHEHGNVRCYYLLRPGLVRDLLQLFGRNYPVVERTPEAVRRAARKRLQREFREPRVGADTVSAPCRTGACP